FDVPDMMDVIPEAYELVDDGVITPEDFRDFTFTNAVRLWGTQNPKFFEGTAVARAAAAALAGAKKATASVCARRGTPPGPGAAHEPPTAHMTSTSWRRLRRLHANPEPAHYFRSRFMYEVASCRSTPYSAG